LGGVFNMRRAICSVASSRSRFFEADMSDTDTYQDPWSSPDGRAALDIFHKELGKTLAAWSAVEDGLFEWFKRCTGMHEQLARAVFYSARSFEGRRDMLNAAIPFSPCNEKTRTGIRLCVARASAYVAFRNRISHGHLLFARPNELEPPQHLFAEGRKLSGPIDEKPNYVTLTDLKMAAINFGELTDCILGFHPEWQAPDVCEAGCLEEIRALPSEANSTEPSRSQP
jgi:hypothetical protein